MAPLRVTFSNFEGQFCCLKPLCPNRHSGSRPQRCAGRVIRGVINHIGGNRRWLITVQLTSTRVVVWKSVDDTHGIAWSLCDSCA